MKIPVLKLIAAINGKVMGFKKKVPNIEANIFALKRYANRAPNTK